MILRADHHPAAICFQARRQPVGMVISQHPALVPRHHPRPGIHIFRDQRTRAPVVLGDHLTAEFSLHEGALVGYLGRSEQSLLTFLPGEEPERSAAIAALTEALGELVVEGRRKAVLISTIDGQPTREMSESKDTGPPR